MNTISKLSPNQALWEKGDFTRIAASMRTAGTHLVAQLNITPSLKVLDLGCGDGTTALPAARLGAKVTGVDIARNLVEAGNRSARDEGLDNCTFQHGDATGLVNQADRSFDLSMSTFGAIFAPKPHDVAKELVRVTKAGGRVVMGNWIPNDPTLIAQILKICSAFTPPPPEGFVSPMLWGLESHVVERFTAAGVAAEKVTFKRKTFTFDYNGSSAEFVAEFRDYYGPTMNAFAAAEKNACAARLQKELVDLFVSHNQSQDPARTTIPATYLEVSVAL